MSLNVVCLKEKYTIYCGIPYLEYFEIRSFRVVMGAIAFIKKRFQEGTAVLLVVVDY